MLDSPVERRRLSDIAYERLRNAIVTGELPAGEKVRDAQLSARLGLSRTPVREALARLVDSGLVEAKPGVHTRVSSLSRHDVENTLSVLQALDQLAVRTAVPRLTPADIDAMQAAQADFAKASRSDDVVAALAADDEFHGVVIRAADNPVLARLIDQIHPMVHRVLYRKFSSIMGGQDTIEHHDRLVDLCAAGDADQAAIVSADHWRHLGGLIGELFDAEELTDAAP
jgi:DNA-binding GntR family transcriptional regulator